MDRAELEDLFELYLMYKCWKQYSRKKKKWIHKINKSRAECGAHAWLMPQLKEDPGEFLNYCRMSEASFQELLYIITDDIKKSDTKFRKAIDPELKLMLTLRFLATGASFQSLHYQFRVGVTTAREAVYDVCAAIWKRLGPLEIPSQTTETLRDIAGNFLALWQYPNCIGALNGKQISVQCPNNGGSGSEFYASDRGTYSITLQAVADADGRFTFIDVGDYGRHYDARAFKNSSLGKALMNNEIPLPENESLFGSESLPFVFICDEAYPLMNNLMKPYPKRDLTLSKRIYNYRHARAKRVIDFAFEMLTFKWGALKTKLIMNPEHAKAVTLACCVLHNFVRRREGKENISEFTFENDNASPAPVFVDQLNALQGRPPDYALHVRNQLSTIMEEKITLPWNGQS